MDLSVHKGITTISLIAILSHPISLSLTTRELENFSVIFSLFQFCTGLPKTRSGKIMRRILRKVAAGHPDDLGDVSTLSDPSVVEEIVENHINNYF